MIYISENTLWIITVIIFVISYFAVSYKAGFLPLFDPRSGRAAWEIKKDKVLPFSIAATLALAALYMFFYILVDSFNDRQLLFVLNSVSILFLLLHWILLKTPIRIKDKKEMRNVFDDAGDWKVPNSRDNNSD